MEFRRFMINGKQVKHYKRECSKCGKKEWMIFNYTTSPSIKMCSSCSKIYKSPTREIHTKENQPEDEVKDAKMIQEWLKKNKPSVEFAK